MSAQQSPGTPVSPKGWLGIGSAAMADLLDGPAARRAVLSVLHPGGPRCPKCSIEIDARIRARFEALHPVRCPVCGTKWSWRTGTPLAGSTLTPGAALALALGVHLDIPTETIAQWTGLCPSSVRGWRVKIRALERAKEEAHAG